MELTAITELKEVEERAVIINVGTKLVTTLALMSTLKFAQMPVLMIDCESKDGSSAHFSQLMKIVDFDLLSVPLDDHGRKLDWLFQNIPARKLLLVDSDLEILNAEIVTVMKGFIDDEKVFGCGFIHGPCWLSAQSELGSEGMGYYQERPWMPLTMLKTSLVREAMANGCSFVDQVIYNDFAPSFRISQWLHRRFRYARLRHYQLSWLNPFKQSFYGHKPSYVFCDTGANIYQFLKYQCNYDFVGYPARFYERYVNHFHGVTRRLLNATDQNAAELSSVNLHVQQRLHQQYGICITT